MFSKGKIFIALAFVFTLIFSASFQLPVANANSKTVTVKGSRLNSDFIITGKGAGLKKIIHLQSKIMDLAKLLFIRF